MLFLKQSTAATVLIGPVLDANGALVTSGLVIGDLRISKNGTITTMSGNTLTHSHAGHWTIALGTGDTDTTGRLTISVGNTSYAMAFRDYTVLLASVFDALITNATNTTGGLATATGSISALAGAISTLTAPQVRTELATELGRIDVATSTRMATYTQPVGFLAATFPTTVASTTNITSASGVTLAAVTHTGAVIPTVSTVTNGVTVSTNNDKTGYTATVSDKTGFSLASNGLASVTAWTVAITGNITGNLSGSVGSVSGVSFPTNFASLGINASGHVSRVVLVDTTTTNTDMRGTDGAALASAWTATRAGYLDQLPNKASQTSVDALPSATSNAAAVWNALVSSYTVNGSFGGQLVRSTNSNNQVQLTGGPNPHIAASVHAVENAAITSAAFAANWLTASGLASDAVAEIADGVWDEVTSGHTTAGTTGKALIDAGSAGNPWSTDISTGYSGTQAGNILNSVKTQTDLIQSGGTVYVTSPVTASGQLTSPLVIGDDYLAANGRKFRWTVALPSGYVIGTSSCKFGMRFEDDEGVNSFIATGTVSDAGAGNVYLDFDVPKATTGTLRPGWYDWSVEIVSASGVEITRVKSGKNAEWVEKQT